MELPTSPTDHTEEENTVEVMASLISSEATAMVKEEIFRKILSEKEKLPTVSMLDFAGQLAYYACHQIYVTPKAFFILVLDMTKKFEDVVSKEKDNQEGSIFSVWTYKDYLKFWITSIKTFGGKKAPLFLVVTHTEKKSKDEIEKYFGEFWKAVPDEDRDWLSESLNDREYAVGLKTLNDNTKEILDLMKKSIVELFTDENNTKVELPSSWALMEQLLYDGGWKVLSLSEIWKLNTSLPHEYQIKSNEEMTKFLRCFHDSGLLLNFEEVELREHVILDIQWLANAFSKIIADENHITKDCKRKLIKEWKSFNKTGELKDKVINALWKDEPSYVKHKNEIMPYMEKLQMLVHLNADEAVSEDGMSWYVPCMNKKQFKADFCEDKWECSSILCYRFTSFAMFVFYRLIAYCISSLRWSVAKDEDNDGCPCLYQTAAVFDHNEHTVVVGICNDDIQLQVLRIKPLTIDKEVSNEIGDSIDKAIEKLTETFIDTKIFHRGYKCQNIICDERDLSFTLASELSKIKAEETQCKCQLKEKHMINVQMTVSFWEKTKMSVSKTPVASGRHELEGRSRFAKLGMATNDVLNQAYRDILEMEVPPSDIEKKAKASAVYKRLRPEQEQLLLDAKHLGYKNFDISLTYTLIRNICSKIPKPTKGKWGEEPAAGEVTVGDDIERIRIIRNSLTAHVRSASTSQTEFDDTWTTMSDICRRLETFTGKKYSDNLNSIYKLTLKDEDALLKKVMSNLQKLMSDMQEVKSDVKKLKQN
ncbi:probable serine/threonine-protein kinase pats1 [Saccostrea cucullata]|uniref:probable serine/threonine-protein kinase pats1 n=1 Tax=Saccostrea cuccullata TaxID=36930 RepID=UPI002ED304C2